ncbi:MAG: FG-GAP repeat protein [Opitutaceae bacterium]|nr:FG-GAP repeat protein [Opitutaceae bacterium]
MKTTSLTKPGNSHVAALAAAIAIAVATINPLSPTVRASTLTAPDGAQYDYFGYSVSASGSGALVGATGDDSNETNNGAAYYYKELDQVNGNSTNEPVKLLASDGTADDYFGASVSQSVSQPGVNALVGAYSADGKVSTSGSAYYYKELDKVSVQITTETVKLLASDGEASDYFGESVSLSGDNALIGARADDDNEWASGSAYYYHELDQVSANLASLPDYGKYSTYETVKLLASDGAREDYFGYSVSLSEDNALVGAGYADTNGKSNSGAAYYYKELDQVSANLANLPDYGKYSTYETVKLLASDGAQHDYFGYSVSLSEDNALVGAFRAGDKGAAYYYKELDQVTDNLADLDGYEKYSTYETVKLLASDGEAGDYFGRSVSLSGNNALVGAIYNNGYGENSGAAYYYKGLDQVNGNSTTETVKLLASDGADEDIFGESVSLDGDRFVIGATHDGGMPGKAYAGDIRAFTTLDAANVNGTALATDGLSFVSQTDWIIGATTANNTVTLTAGDTADVTATDKAVYIGQTAGADNNTLIIEGTLTATTVYVGAGGSDSPTTGNTLRFTEAALATLTIDTLYLDAGNFLEFEGTGLDIDDVLTLLHGTATVQVRGSSSEGWDTLDAENAATLLAKTGEVVYGDNGTWTRFTTFSAPAVPEPAGWAVLAGLTLLVFAVALRRPRGKRV